MPVRLGYYAYGGGAGDIWWDYLHDKATWRMKSLVKDYGCRIRVYCVCHNPGVVDFFQAHPYVAETLLEPWAPPTPESAARFANPIDGYIPIQREDLFRAHYGMDFQLEQPEVYLTPAEQARLAALCGERPLIVAQPFAGLSDRDAFDAPTFAKTVAQLVRLDPRVRVVILGSNHTRTHKYTVESIPLQSPNVVNLIDKVGLRFAWHLVRQADAFLGSHSNLIRAAWDARKRNVCVLPWPLMERHLSEIDGKYVFGFRYPESARFTFPFDGSGERQFDKLDTGGIARFLLGRE